MLQRASSSYLAELKSSLPRFLFARSKDGTSRARRRVRVATTNQLVRLVTKPRALHFTKFDKPTVGTFPGMASAP